jgi:hypothetical protein
MQGASRGRRTAELWAGMELGWLAVGWLEQRLTIRVFR